MPAKILVVDDEESLCEILKYNLEKEGYDVTTAYSAEEALTLDLSEFSLMIVDIMMERLSGFDFVKRLRINSATEYTPVFFCSALTGEDDTVMGLNIGADDYIKKPFVIPEVLARVRAILRRNGAKPVAAQPEPAKNIYEPDVTFRNLRIDRNEKLCYINNEEIALTRTELDILLFLLIHRNRIYSREEIIHNVWSNDVIVTNRTIDTNIARLRKKIGEYGNNIVTRLGFGYGFKETV